MTLYFTQQDFDYYNNYVTASNLNYPLLPTGGVDNGHVRISQFHGSFTASPDPGNYNSGDKVMITPFVSWDQLNNHFIHLDPAAAIQFYRLKMTDIDGLYNYSNVIKVKYRKENAILSIYPNPVTLILQLKIISGRSEYTTVKITDASGKVVDQKIILVNTGTTSSSMNVERLPVGVYYMNVKINGKLQQVSFMKE